MSVGCGGAIGERASFGTRDEGWEGSVDKASERFSRWCLTGRVWSVDCLLLFTHERRSGRRFGVQPVWGTSSRFVSMEHVLLLASRESSMHPSGVAANG
jgi:hypothetical protein